MNGNSIFVSGVKCFRLKLKMCDVVSDLTFLRGVRAAAIIVTIVSKPSNPGQTKWTNTFAVNSTNRRLHVPNITILLLLLLVGKRSSRLDWGALSTVFSIYPAICVRYRLLWFGYAWKWGAHCTIDYHCNGNGITIVISLDFYCCFVCPVATLVPAILRQLAPAVLRILSSD